MPLTVLHVDTGRSLGGGQRQVLSLLEGLCAAGHAPVLAAPPGAPLLAAAAASGVPAHGVPMRGGVDVVAAFRLAALARSGAAQVLHAHTAHAHTLLLGAAAALGRPLVVTRRNLRGPARPPLRGMAYRRPARVLCISEAVRDEMARLGVPAERLALAPSALTRAARVPPTVALALRARLAEGRAPLLVAVGSLSPLKDHATLVEAAALLAARWPSLLVLVAGEGPLASALATRIASRGLGDHVRLLGHVEDPTPLLAAADVVVHPSLSEGLGVAVLEALAQETPVIVTRRTGAAALVESTGAGAVVDAGAPGALAAACAEVLAVPANEMAARLRRARDRVLREHAPDRMVSATLEAYEAVLEDRARPRRARGASGTS